MLSKVKSIKGFKLEAIDGDIGKVEEFYFDDRRWTIRYLVADTGTWLAERQVLISPYALLSVLKDDKHISVNLTKKQIEESPSLYTDKPVSQQFEEAYYGYYGWPMYWSGPYTWGVNPYLMREFDQAKEPAEKAQAKAWDHHLRSTADVSGYHVQAVDGEIGHVSDFIIDDDNWSIRYLVVDTRNWLPGKKVLVSPRWIERVSWPESKVFANLSREAIQESPEYTDEFLLTRDYETELHRHYNLEGYWVDELTISQERP